MNLLQSIYSRWNIHYQWYTCCYVCCNLNIANITNLQTNASIHKQVTSLSYLYTHPSANLSSLKDLDALSLLDFYLFSIQIACLQILIGYGTLSLMPCLYKALISCFLIDPHSSRHFNSTESLSIYIFEVQLGRSNVLKYYCSAY